jgi:hypothetical protein
VQEALPKPHCQYTTGRSRGVQKGKVCIDFLSFFDKNELFLLMFLFALDFLIKLSSFVAMRRIYE